MSPERLACVSAFGMVGLSAVVLIIVLLVLYRRACRTPES